MPKNSQPVISVAIATRNYGRYLARALDSVLRCHNPTEAPLQVVVADDASTDNTRAVLADYRRRYPENLEVVLIRMPGGLGAAKNAALDRCRGRTVAILDADDEFLPDKLVPCHAALARGGVDIVTNDFYHQTEGGGLLPQSRRTWVDWFWPPSTWVFRNGVVRFNPHSLGAEDLEWMQRRWPSLRHQHLDLTLNVQHLHGDRYGWTWDSLTPARQVIGRMRGATDPADGLAPRGWACRACGNQYLLPARCCGQGTVARPLLFYWTAFAPHCRAYTEFSLVILTRNGLALSRRAVSSLLDRVPADRRRDVELIFVDGCSSDGTIDYIRGLAETYPVKLIVTHPSERFNFARSCNRGAHAAVGKYLLLLNNDIEVRSDDPWGPLREALEDPRVGVVGASTVWNAAQRDPEWKASSPSYLFVSRPVTGEFWGARREVYWELGGLDTTFAGYGYEELDFQYRAQLAHYRLALARVRVHHDAHGTFRPVYGAAAMQEMGAENRRVFERKHGRLIYATGARIEPYASHRPAERSVIVMARDKALLRETLKRAVQDPRCQGGTMQVVVVDHGATDDVTLLLEEYRLCLPYGLTVISLPEPLAPARAQQIGRARAIGQVVRAIQPGEWRESTPVVPTGSLSSVATVARPF